jgi:hypothetical protein
MAFAQAMLIEVTFGSGNNMAVYMVLLANRIQSPNKLEVDALPPTLLFLFFFLKTS